MAQRPKPHLLNTQTKTQNLTFTCLAFSSQTRFQSSSVPLLVQGFLKREQVLFFFFFQSVHHDFKHVAELSLCLRFLLMITATGPPYSHCDTEIKTATPWATVSLPHVVTVLREPLTQTLFYPSKAKFWRGNSVNHFNFPWSHPVWVSSPPTEITKHPIRVLKVGCTCASISLICQTLSSLRVKNTSALFTTVSSEPTERSTPSTYKKYTK